MSTNYRQVTVTLGGGGTLIASIVTDSVKSDQEVRSEVLNAVRSSEISRYVMKDGVENSGIEVSMPEPVSFPAGVDLDKPEWVKDGDNFWRF